MELLQDEVLLNTDASLGLSLTTHRLIYEKIELGGRNYSMTNSIAVLPIDEISFIGYKKITNMPQLILGVILTLIGLIWSMGTIVGGSFKQSQSTPVLIVLLFLGIIICLNAQKRFINIASSGGEINLKSDNIENFKKWIFAIAVAKDKFIKMYEK